MYLVSVDICVTIVKGKISPLLISLLFSFCEHLCHHSKRKNFTLINFTFIGIFGSLIRKYGWLRMVLATLQARTVSKYFWQGSVLDRLNACNFTEN